MKRSNEITNGSNDMSNIVSAKPKRTKIDHYNIVDVHSLPYKVLHDGSIQQVVKDKDGNYALEKFKGTISTNSYWVQASEYADANERAENIASIEEWAIYYKQIFILKKEDGRPVFKNIFNHSIDDVSFHLYLLPDSIKETLCDWKKHLKEICVNDDGQIALQKKKHDGHLEIGTFWCLDVDDDLTFEVLMWGHKRMYTLESVSDKGCCILKSMYNNKVYRCNSILSFVFLPNILKTFFLEESKSSKFQIPKDYLKMSKKVVLCYGGKCQYVRVMKYDIVLHKNRLGRICDIGYYEGDFTAITSHIIIQYADDLRVIKYLRKDIIDEKRKTLTEDIQFLRRPGSLPFKAPATPSFYYDILKTGMTYKDFQPIPVRKGDKVMFKPDFVKFASAYKIVEVKNNETDGIIVQSCNNANEEYFTKIADISYCSRS